MSLAVVIGLPGSGKTWGACNAAHTRALAASHDARALAWGPRLEYWPRTTVAEWSAAPLPRAVLDDDAATALAYCIDACEADACAAVVVDEAHRLFEGGEPGGEILSQVAREHRHTGAAWYVCTQNLVGLPSVLEADASYLVIHRFDARHELSRLRAYDGYRWATLRPAWIADGAPLETLVGDERMCHSAIVADRDRALLGWRPCACKRVARDVRFEAP